MVAMTRKAIMIGLLVSLSARGQEFSATAIDYLKAQEAVNGFSGTVLVARDGKALLRTGIGPANRELGVPNRPETKFRLGSITKQFTATAVMMLEQRGKLKVDDTIDKHIPNAPEAWKRVTVHHLLNHTSGIPSYTSQPNYRKDMVLPLGLPDLIGRFRDKPLDFEPGSDYRYNNSGYALLGDIIQRVSGESYEEFLKKNIFDPLAMKDTGYDHWDTILENRASGYSRIAGRFTNALYLDMSQPYAAGALYSTVDDLWIWDRALYTDKVLPQAVLQRMFTPGRSNYGYGWGISKESGREQIGHGGGINGFSTVITRTPASKTLVVVLSNLEQANAGRIGRDLDAILHGEKFETPKIRTQIPMRPETFDAYVGKYELRPGFQIVTSREGNRFLAQPTGQAKVEIFPESETKFFLRVTDAQITFQKSPDGKVTGLVLNQNGREQPGKRIE
jgi:CubicO group peptidase (beta-lactamase class C family)